MDALQLFKQAGIWDTIKDYADSDYVKYPLIGAGVGGLGMGAASAIGGGEEDEKPDAKRNRILMSALKGMGYGGVAGAGVAGAKDFFDHGLDGKSDESESGDGDKSNSIKPKGKEYGGVGLGGATTIGGAVGAGAGYRSGGNAIKEYNSNIDQFNKDGRGVVDDVNKHMTSDKPPASLDELLGKMKSVNTDLAPVAAGAGAKAISHAQGGAPTMSPSILGASTELDAGLQKMVGSGDASSHAGLLSKWFGGKGGAHASGMDNLRESTVDYAQNGFKDSPHLGFMGSAGKRIGHTLGGLAVGAGIGAGSSLLGTAMSEPYGMKPSSAMPSFK